VIEREVIVVGGGVAGLACALELAEHGREVAVLEAAARVGGPVETRVEGDLILERGPQTVRATPELESLFARTGLEPIRAARLPPSVLRDGRIYRIPPSLGDLASGALVPPGSLLGGLLLEPFRRHGPGPRTVQELVRERLGPRVADAVADLLTLGVYAQPADRIGFESAYPGLADDLARHGSLTRTLIARRWRARGGRGYRGGIVSSKNGLGELLTRAGRLLGERLFLRTRARRVETAGAKIRVHTLDPERTFEAPEVVLAIPPGEAAGLVEGTRAAGLLARTRSAPQALAQFVLKDPGAAERLRTLGFLVPAREGLPIAGCLLPNALFPGRAPRDVVLLTAFVGPALIEASDSEIGRVVGSLLGRILGTGRAPELLDVARHPAGIAVYDRRHRERTRIARCRLAEETGALLAGAGYDGVGLGTAAASGVAAAREILSSR
jgi:oxygen-dependent protoporphyrinogen oxidase